MHLSGCSCLPDVLSVSQVPANAGETAGSPRARGAATAYQNLLHAL